MFFKAAFLLNGPRKCIYWVMVTRADSVGFGRSKQRQVRITYTQHGGRAPGL